MSCKMCNTQKSRCPAFDDRFPLCGLGFPIEEKAHTTVFGVDMRYYGCVGSCTKPKSLKEFVDMSLYQSHTQKAAI